MVGSEEYVLEGYQLSFIELHVNAAEMSNVTINGLYIMVYHMKLPFCRLKNWKNWQFHIVQPNVLGTFQ